MIRCTKSKGQKKTKKIKNNLKTILTNEKTCCTITFVVDLYSNLIAQIAQLVEQRTENPRVAGSIPALGITRKGFIYMRV